MSNDMLIQVRDNDRFEGIVDGEVVAWANLRRFGSRIVIHHTVVEPHRRGSGIGSRFVEGVLDNLVANEETLTNYCPFVTSFLQAHPRYQRLIDPTHPGQWPPAGESEPLGTQT